MLCVVIKRPSACRFCLYLEPRVDVDDSAEDFPNKLLLNAHPWARLGGDECASPRHASIDSAWRMETSRAAETEGNVLLASAGLRLASARLASAAAAAATAAPPLGPCTALPCTNESLRLSPKQLNNTALDKPQSAPRRVSSHACALGVGVKTGETENSGDKRKEGKRRREWCYWSWMVLFERYYNSLETFFWHHYYAKGEKPKNDG